MFPKTLTVTHAHPALNKIHTPLILGATLPDPFRESTIAIKRKIKNLLLSCQLPSRVTLDKITLNHSKTANLQHYLPAFVRRTVSPYLYFTCLWNRFSYIPENSSALINHREKTPDVFSLTPNPKTMATMPLLPSLGKGWAESLVSPVHHLPCGQIYQNNGSKRIILVVF